MLLAPFAAFVAFVPALWAGFLADDFVMLQTVHRLDLPLQAFTRTDIGTTRGDPYRPLWLVANGAINRVTGDNALAYHLFSLVLYAAAAVLVVVIAGRFVERPVAVLAGVAFALYPRHAEAVAWIGASPDVMAGILSLAALAALTVRGAPTWALVASVVLGVAAPLCKESAFALPALALVLVGALWSDDAVPIRRRRAAATAVLIVGTGVDLLVRTMVVHGLGDYVGEPFGLHRLAVVVGSQLLATFTTSQMLVLEHPALLVIPVVLAALVVFGAVQTLRSGDGSRQRLLAVGALWYVLALIPVYNNAVALNNSNGERLLYLPSVGAALVIGAVAAPLLEVRPGRVVLALGAGAAVAACLAASMDYVTAGVIRDRVVADTSRLAPEHATVVALNIPDSYRSARLLSAGFAQAVAMAGRPDLNVLVCAPSIIETGQSQAVHFTVQPGGELLARSTASLPFETPESGRSISTSGCVYRPSPLGHLAPGLGTAVLLRLTPTGTDTVYLWFDGVNMRACDPLACSGLASGEVARATS